MLRIIFILCFQDRIKVGADHIYAAELRNGRLLLLERSAKSDRDKGFLGLIEDAKQIEFDKKIEQFTKNHNISDTKDSLVALGSQGPEGYLSAYRKSRDIGKQDSLLRDLASSAQAIVDAKTLFVLPDFLPDELADGSGVLRDVFLTLGEQIVQFLDNSPKTPSFSFVRLAPKKKPSHQSPARMFINSLLIQTSSAFIHNNQAEFAKDGPLLLEGPTGSGKTSAAELISWQRGAKFMKINISAITESLLESRMRGTVKGAATDAINRPSWFESSDQGVLFLDEFQKAPMPIQTQLLDLLDPVSDVVNVSRIGNDAAPEQFRVKVMLAVNEEINLLLKEKRLREDLFYRIRSVVKLQSLCELLAKRDSDSSKLIRKLLYIYRWKAAPIISNDGELPANWPQLDKLFPEFGDREITAFFSYEWPGNFRELERVVFDLYWDFDRSPSTKRIEVPAIENKIRHAAAFAKNIHSRVSTSVLAPDEKEKLNKVEEILIEESFNIAKSKERLSVYKLKSRQTLRAYLINMQEHLRPELKKSAKLMAFLKIAL